jgi:DNA-binding CsgD family transcriptional regulator
MPRKRAIQIAERLTTLRRLERSAKDEAARMRFGVLRLLKESPHLTLTEIADATGSSVRTVKRWTAIYQRRGLQGLLSLGSYESVSDDLEAEIAMRLGRGEFRSASHVRDWLRETHGISPSLPAVAALINRCTQTHVLRGAASPARSREPDRESEVARWLCAFLESLPERMTAREWAELFRASLAAFLDVDRASVDINMVAGHKKPSTSRDRIAINETAEGGSTARSTMTVSDTSAGGSRIQSIMRKIEQGGLALEDFHEPFVQEYTLSDGTYLGIVILWKARHRKPLTDNVKTTLVSMRGIIMRMMLDCSARHEAQQPVNRQFYNVLRAMIVDYKLSHTEQSCATLLLLGHKRREIARELHMSEANVAKTLTSVYRKTGTDSIVSLTALLFAPRT